MTFIINPKCNKCGNRLTIKLNIVDKLKEEIRVLKKQLDDIKAMESFKSIFGGFK